MRALIALYPLESVVVWSPTAARCARLAARISEEEGLPVSAAASAAEAVAGADLVVCCTSAATPVVHARMLGAGDVTVAAIGAYTPQMVEVDPSVFALAGTVYVDDLTGALHEAGDVLAALRSGAVAADAVSPIGGDVRRARVALFKSVGNAAQDAAVAGAIAGPPHE
jgi:ornithine cyclodeaminase